MAKLTMNDYRQRNMFEEARERYEHTTARWKNSWWQVICDIWEQAQEWREKYDLDQIARIVIEKIKGTIAEQVTSVARTGIKIVEKVSTNFIKGTKLCYLFKFYDSNGELLFSKVGTTERKLKQRLSEEINYYRKRGIDVGYATIESVFDTGDLEPEGAQDYAKGHYVRLHKGNYLRNDRFTCDIDVNSFNNLMKDYLAV